MDEERLCLALDRFEIRDLIESWALWRDSGEWERFRALWHDDARMVTTWCDAGVDDFIAMCQAAWTDGSINAIHLLGGTALDVVGDRAVAQTRMTIIQRAPLNGTLADVTGMGRFYDLLERRNGRWGLVLRHPIYEMDRIDPVAPVADLGLDQALLDELPAGYRHLAYLQIVLGRSINRKLPGRSGPEIEALYARGSAWLARSSPADTDRRTAIWRP